MGSSSPARPVPGPRTTLVALLVVVLLAVLAAALLGRPSGHLEADPSADGGTSTPTDVTSPDEVGAGTASGTGASPTAPPGAPPVDGGTPTGGIEAAPSAPVTLQPGDAVREDEETEGPAPVVDGPFPATSESASGRLVATYPTDVLPLAPGATVTTSSVSTSTERVQVALEADHASSPDVLAFYLRELGRQGFVEEPVTSLPGQSGVALRRDGSSVVVTTDTAAGTFTVLATLVREDA